MKDMTMTQHKNCILNPDIVFEWYKEDINKPKVIKDRESRAKALLPNVSMYYSSEYPRALKAVELWEYYSSL